MINDSWKLFILVLIIIFFLVVVFQYFMVDSSQKENAYLYDNKNSCRIINPPNVNQLIPINNVQVWSQQTNNLADPTATLDKLIDNNYTSYWNPGGNTTDYRLQLNLSRLTPVQGLVVVSSGDGIHDSTGVEIYRDNTFTGAPLLQQNLQTGTHSPQLVDLSTLNLNTNSIFLRLLPAPTFITGSNPPNLIVNEIQVV